MSKKILLVEDEALIAMTEKMQLEKYGYTVHHVTTGEKAVQTITDNTHPVDLILMDIDLGPGIDGTQASEQILNYKDIPVVFLSSHTDPEVVEKTEKITSYGYVVKSSSIVVLDASIKMAFRLFASKFIEQKKEVLLRQSEERYKTLFLEMLEGFALHEIILDTDGMPVDYRFIAVNPAFEHLTGLKATHIVNRTVLEVMPDIDRHWIDTYGRVALSGESVFFENYSTPLAKHFKVTAFRVVTGQIACIFEDITERKQADEELRKNEKLLNSTQQLARVGGWVWDIEQQAMTWTDETYFIHGMTPGEFAPGTPEHISVSLACYDPADRPVIEAAFGLCAANGQPYDLEFPLTRIDGSRIWIRTMAYAEKQGDRVVRVFGNIMDITDRKRYETALLESQLRYKTSQEIGHVGNWEYDLNTGQYWGSDEVKRIYGFDPNQDNFSTEAVESCIPERDRIHQALMDLIEKDAEYKLEFQIFPVNSKQPKTIVSLAELRKDDKGLPLMVCGIIQDITERKRMENILEEKLKLTEMLLDALPHPAMLIRAKDKVILAANKILLQYGAKIGGHCWREVGKEDYISNDFKEIAKMNPSNVSEAHGIHCTFCQGDLCFTLSPEQNNPDVHSLGKRWDTYWIKVNDEIYLHYFIDITDRKQAEEEIKKQLSEKETLLREVHHRVKNNIANIEGLLLLQSDSSTNREVKAALRDAISRVQSMRVLYDKLLLSKDYQDVSIKTYIESFIDSLLAVFVLKNNITVKKQIANFNILSKQAITIGIIINELLTNVFKYAFKGRDKGTVSVSIEKSGNKVTLVVQDNGIGIDERIMENKSPGFGLTIVKMLVEQLDGTYSVVNENGTKSVVQFEL